MELPVANHPLLMLDRLHKTANLLDAVNERLGHAVSWAGIAVVVVAFAVVVMRYAFDQGSIAMQEATL